MNCEKLSTKISASMMCANPFYLAQSIKALEAGKVEYLHQDVMDGKFVPNLGMSIDHMRFMRKSTAIPFDFHVMTLEPDNIIPLLEPRPGDIVSIHYESTFQVQRTLENARRYGCKVFVAINPSTSLSVLDELVYYVDGINLLMVNPGFAGQKAVDSCFHKARRLRDFLARHERADIAWEVDGNISASNARLLRKLGANIFVCGTSSIFIGGVVDENAIGEMRNVL